VRIFHGVEVVMARKAGGLSIAKPGIGTLFGLLLLAGARARADEFVTSLPPGVKAVWDLGAAARETTPHRERVCINGLWRWQPAGADASRPPAQGWGFFKVPGPWPGGYDDMMRDSQTLHRHPDWKDVRLGDLTAAWYEREVAFPAAWSGRRIALNVEYLNSYAAVFVDGRKAGEVRFPGGEIDLTALCRPGATHVLSLQPAPGISRGAGPRPVLPA
jgi:hypothetical protein